jgi:ATP-dependent phosphofructokinase / diphosphate-dependent phosphofructokinase
MPSSPCFSRNGPVDQLGMIAAFATRKPRVQIPLGPLVGFGGVGYYIGKEIEKRFENIETGAVVLGHLQRGGSPNAFDRVLATRFGIVAIDLVHEGRFDQMVAVQGNVMVSVPLEDVIGKRKTIDSNLCEIAATFFGKARPIA